MGKRQICEFSEVEWEPAFTENQLHPSASRVVGGMVSVSIRVKMFLDKKSLSVEMLRGFFLCSKIQ